MVTLHITIKILLHTVHTYNKRKNNVRLQSVIYFILFSRLLIHVTLTLYDQFLFCFIYFYLNKHAYLMHLGLHIFCVTVHPVKSFFIHAFLCDIELYTDLPLVEKDESHLENVFSVF